MTTKKRIRITVRGHIGRWVVAIEKQDQVVFVLKFNAVRFARTTAKRLEEEGTYSQVVVFKGNGQIATEWTYPRSSDPRESKG